jgi:hypothetical protein
LPPGLGLFKRLILVARIVGFSAVITGTALIIREVAGQLASGGAGMTPPRLAWLITILAMAIAGCVLSWRRLRLAGILLIVSGIAAGVDAAVIAGRNQLILLVLGLPFIITGLLFLKSRRLLKPQPKNDRP